MGAPLSSTDRHHLRRALEIGRRGWGGAHPNPLVGCVLVREGVVVGEGWHECFGEAHAEANALERAGGRAKGATAYVSLEPCAHFGHTPPCASALAAAGVARVVFGAEDPGGESAGGADILKEAGVEVIGPVLTPEEAERENPAFFHNSRRNATYLALKLAQTLDGRIAEAPGIRTPITGEAALRETHRLRAGFDGIMVGADTVLADDPLLTVRQEVPHRKQPTRLVLDSRARLSPSARLFDTLSEAPLIIFTGSDAPDEKVARLEGGGATILRIPKAEVGLSLPAVLEACWTLGLGSILCEGGGRLASELLKGSLARRLYLFVAPFVLGDRGVPAFPGLSGREVWKRWQPAGPPQGFERDVLLTFDWTD